ncbi:MULTISPECIES: hypothetical protein [unclassified Lentimicrobium]|uniref:hypothetical protein n=1 Tax=unclassified Lentimicrobium TaxID=2677434 RepID=UPI001552B6CD|nr:MULTISPECIES: hypothetical protein [unclassified Lentimicrobium]NPD47469.1 hypothetical protein [Lentimicrobium sp. S6]NPD86857.1 hypothetical protein [Lentimicrobium sp. L6]
MTFKEAAILGSFLAKEYTEEFFKLLVNYRSISSSEAASRLNLHIKTAQDFLEAMTKLGILEKEEVYEKKRPYNRYTLLVNRITIDLDLEVLGTKTDPQDHSTMHIREHKNAGVNFYTARNNEYFSSVAVWIGKGRERTERKINLTKPQGKFLFHLPFPTAYFESVATIMRKADVEESEISEILDIVYALIELKVIEKE